MKRTTIIALLCFWAGAGIVAAEEKANYDLKDLYKHWRHAREEQKNDGVEIYRPANTHKFPMSRFRMAYKFQTEGKCQWYYLSPRDAHHFKNGSWSIDEKDKGLLTIRSNRKQTYRIVELTKDVLKLAPAK
jgi:hypothetical protein